MKDCSKYTEYLEVYTVPHEAGDDFIALEEHLAACSACREKLRNIQKFDVKVKERIRDIPVPPDLKKKIRFNMEYENRSGKRRGKPAIVTYAAIAAALALAFTFMFGYFQKEATLDDVITASIKSHNKNMDAEFSNEIKGEQVTEWFENKLSFNVPVPDLNNSIQFAGGRKCDLSKIDVAYLFYKKNQKRISLYIFDNKEFKLSKPAMRKKIIRQDNNTVALWNKGSIGYCLVSDLDIPEVENLLQKQ
ncbi:MAG: DUF3379 family protein [bacterium]|nr:DUF3379 family protein [bacterium]